MRFIIIMYSIVGIAIGLFCLETIRLHTSYSSPDSKLYASSAVVLPLGMKSADTIFSDSRMSTSETAEKLKYINKQQDDLCEAHHERRKRSNREQLKKYIMMKRSTSSTSLSSKYCKMYWKDCYQVLSGLYRVSSSRTSEIILLPSSQTGYCTLNTSTRQNLREVLEELHPLPSLQSIPSFVSFESLSQSNISPRRNQQFMIPQLPPETCSQLLQEAVIEEETEIPTNPLLLILTTCNHLEYTIKFIKAIEEVSDAFDVLVVDDFSTDDTVSYLQSRGYAVLTKNQSMGLTDSWNIGYRFAKRHKYSYVIFANNDALVPSGAIEMIQASLMSGQSDHVGLVVPLTSKKGAGHNPSQSLVETYASKFGPQNISFYEEFLCNPSNMNSIQSALSQIYRSQSSGTSELPVSVWDGKVKFNGFFFAINMEIIKVAAFDKENLFNTSNIIVGQEDCLVKRMISWGILPRICKYAFVYHHKSATVKSNNHSDSYGNQVHFPETRNNLTLYHEEKALKGYPSILSPLKQYFHLASAVSNSASSIYFAKDCQWNKSTVIAMATSDPIRSPTAGDIFTAKELAESLLGRFEVKIVMLHRGVNWYDLHNVDILITFLDSYNLQLTRNEAPHLIKVAWMRNWFQRWMTQPWMGNYDLLLVSSSIAKSFFEEFVNRNGGFPLSCHYRCPFSKSLKKFGLKGLRSKRKVPIEVFYLATNPKRFSPQPISNINKTLLDFVFTGNYWNQPRELMLENPMVFLAYNGRIFGSGWEKALDMGAINIELRKLIRPAVAYTTLPEIYAATKLVLDDANHASKMWGSVNSRVFDALASGALVVTNGNVSTNNLKHMHHDQQH